MTYQHILVAIDLTSECHPVVARAQALEIPAGRGTTTHITVTVGVFTRVPTPGTEPRHFFEGADAALYQAKAAGRNGYAVDDGGLG